MAKHFYLLLAGLLLSMASKANVGDTTWVTVTPLDSFTYPGAYNFPVLFPDGSTQYRKIYYEVIIGQYDCASGTEYCHQWDYDVENYIMTSAGDTMEMARFITPYATTGTPGFGPTWLQPYIFDVTDFYPLLQDSAWLRINYSGYSYGFTFTIKFAFIEGTPERNVLGIAPIYNSTYSYGDTANPIDSNVRPVTFTPPANSASTEMKLIITGHGFDNASGCCEFDTQSTSIGRAYTVMANNLPIVQNYMNVNCGMSELYPQGGTWLDPRAGNWCPGGLVPIGQYPLAGITPGSPNTADLNFDDTYNGIGSYGIYKIAAQAFSYSAYNKMLDASLEDVIAPTNFPWYRRENPRVSAPVIKVRNTGGSVISSILFSYGVLDSPPTQYIWTGSLSPSADTIISLPAISALTNLSLSGAGGNLTFVAEIELVNGQKDDDPSNDTITSQFSVAPDWPSAVIVKMLTSSIGADGSFGSNPADASWQITDENNNVIASRTNANVSTTYSDTVKFKSPGCYELSVTTSICYGLQWWGLEGITGYTPGAFDVVNYLNGKSTFLTLDGTANGGIYRDDFGCGFNQYFTTSGTCQIVPPVIDQSNFTLTAPEGLTYQWYKNGNPIASATGQVLTAEAGDGNYTVVVTNDSGCSATSESFALIATGIEALSDYSNAISIYPNPARDIVNVVVNAELTGTNFTLRDMMGRVLLTGKLNHESNAIPVGDISAGMYLVTVSDGASGVTRLVAIQH